MQWRNESIHCLGERLTDDEVEQLISEFEDKSGMILYEDFIKTVLSRWTRKTMLRNNEWFSIFTALGISFILPFNL